MNSQAVETGSGDIGEKRSPESPNLLLCRECQIWDDIWAVGVRLRVATSLEDRSYNKDCLVCRIIVQAVSTRRAALPPPQNAWPDSRVSIIERGPFFLDNGVWPTKHESRIDESDPVQIVVRCLVKLSVRLAKGESPWLEASMDFEMSPQLSFIYSRGGTVKLIEVGLWENPFFDVELLKTWLKGCEAIHDNRCLSDGRSSSSKFLCEQMKWLIDTTRGVAQRV